MGADVIQEQTVPAGSATRYYNINNNIVLYYYCIYNLRHQAGLTMAYHNLHPFNDLICLHPLNVSGTQMSTV